MPDQRHAPLTLWWRQLALLAAAAQVLALLFAAAALGDYHVEVCSDLSTGAPSNSSGWTPSTSGTFVGASGCNGGGYMDVALFAGVSHNYTDNGTLVFTAPANTTISSFYLWRWDQAGPSQPYGSPVNTISYDGQAIDACAQPFGCSSEGSTASSSGSVVGASGLTAHQLEVIAACGGGPGGVCPSSSENTEIRIYGGDIDLNQSTSPSANGVTGSLVAAGAHVGVQSVSFNATDNGSGVYSATLLIDGHAVASKVLNTDGGHCVPTRRNSDGSLVFNYVVPCPQSASGAFTYNTAQLANGTHDLQIEITDAAGNTTYAYDGSIDVENPQTSTSPPPGGGSGLLGTTASWQVSLRVSPRHVHRHTVIKLSGLVFTAPRPPDGKLIYLQARSVARGWRRRGRSRRRAWLYGPWITFQELRAKPDGSFNAHYRFKLGGRHHYQMRAVAPQEGGFLDPTGTSRPVAVIER
jgi:hypothetical protein